MSRLFRHLLEICALAFVATLPCAAQNASAQEGCSPTENTHANAQRCSDRANLESYYGNHEGAEADYRRAYEIVVTLYGSDTPGAAEMLIYYALEVRLQNRPAESERLFRQAADVFSRAYGSTSAVALGVRGEMAADIRSQGRYAEAEKIDRKIYEASTQATNLNERDRLSAIEHLAADIRDQSRYTEAEALDRQAYQSSVDATGPASAETADAADGLEADYRAEKRDVEADKLMHQISDAIARKNGRPQPAQDKAEELNLEGNDALSEGNGRLAEDCFRQEYAILSQSLGLDNAKTLEALDRVAKAIGSQGKYAEEETIRRQIYEFTARAKGTDAPETLDALDELAGVLDLEDRSAEAETVYREIHEARLRSNGPDDVKTIVALGNVATALYQQGRFAEAERIERQIPDAMSQAKNAPSGYGLEMDWVVATNNLAISVDAQGRFGEAEALFHKSYDKLLHLRDIDLRLCALEEKMSDALPYARVGVVEERSKVEKEQRQCENSASTSLAGTLWDLAAVIEKQGRYSEAEALLRKRYDIVTKAYGADRPEALIAFKDIADPFFAAQDYAAAEPYFEKAVAGFQHCCGNLHPETIALRARLGDLRATKLERYQEGYPDLKGASDAVWIRARDPNVAANMLTARGVLINSRWIFESQMAAAWGWAQTR